MPVTTPASNRPPAEPKPDPAPTDRTTRDDRFEDARAEGYSLWVIRDGQTATFVLPKSGRVVVGRSRDADVRVDHPSVSREHLAIDLGAPLRVEDLRSANGTRLRGSPLEPGVPLPIQPDDVIDLGAVLLVLRDRSLSAKRDRTCHPALFEIRVEDEDARVDAGGPPYAVARLHLDGPLSQRAAEIIVAAGLTPGDVTCSPAPGRHDVLFLRADPLSAEARLHRIVRSLEERRLEVESTMTCCPRDRSSIKGRRSLSAPQSAPASDAPIAQDETMTRTLRLLERVARSSLSVLLLGETGVGKEVCAAHVHRASARAHGPFLRMNCAALAESLIDAELFGHERGAFTGAISERAGLIEAASGGTLFLDEVGDMPLATQVRLLRVLEAREVMRIGSTKARAVDIRVVAATHRDLAEDITEGRFREDLYYRLNGISVLVPPLRERLDDIEPLARHFLARAGEATHAGHGGHANRGPLPGPGGGRSQGGNGTIATPPRLSPASVAYLRSLTWPGNVRELRNLIERAVVLCEGPSIEPEHLTSGPAAGSAAPGERVSSGVVGAARTSSSSLRTEVDTLERDRIVAALESCGGSQRAAARHLGISRGALLRRLERLGIIGPR